MLSNLRSRVVFSGYLWNKLSIIDLFSLSETGVAYSSRLTRFINVSLLYARLETCQAK